MKEHGTLYTAQSEEILILEITAIAPTVNFNSQRIFSCFKIFCNIKLSRSFTIFTVTDKLFIYTNIKG